MMIQGNCLVSKRLAVAAQAGARAFSGHLAVGAGCGRVGDGAAVVVVAAG
ncbi:MAG: hypothetical protein JXA97_10775 [Anaerolineales bacterium]|nr:hypothetical protein [Anaerolineales bacterium]